MPYSLSLLAYIILLVVTICSLTLAELSQTNLNSIPTLSHFSCSISYCFWIHLILLLRKDTTAAQRQRYRKKSADHKTEIDYKKRILLRAGIASAVALPILYFGLDSLLSSRQAVTTISFILLSQLQKFQVQTLGFEDPRLSPLLESEITPTDLFYRIDKNAIVPVVMREYLEANFERTSYQAFGN